MATKTTQCECQNWFFGSFGPDGSAESFEDYGTECHQTTGRTFAQGHDAKLAGFLVRAELNGEEISRVGGGVKHTFQGPVHAASTISEALAAKVEHMLGVALARLAKKETAANRKATKKATPAKVTVEPTPQPREAKIKVGRWTYDATIAPNGWATYAKKLGGTVSIASTDYTEVN